MKLRFFFLVLIVILFVDFFVVRLAVRRDASCQQIIQDTMKAETVYVPAVPKVLIMPIPSKIDTDAVIRDYFSKKTYRDTVIDLPELKVTLVDTLYRNEIVKRKVDYSFVPEIQIRQPEYELGIGTMAGFRSSTVFVELRKKKVTGMLGYDIYNHTPVLGVKYTIKTW